MARILTKALALALLTLLIPRAGSAQELTLEECWRQAEAHYPLSRQYALIEQTKDYSLSNASKRYLPQLSLTAKASYQSEVTKIPLDFTTLGLPMITLPEVQRDQYGATIDVSQLLWDGGRTAAARSMIRSEAEVSRAETDVSLYALRRRVSEIYFALLLISEQQSYNDLFHEEILRTKHKVETLIQGGVATPTDLDAVEADRIRSERTQSEYLTLRHSYLGALGLLMGDTLPDSTRLSFPEAEARVAGDKARPELEVLALQTQTLGARRRELSASLLPTLGLFAQGGYARPGLNVLERDFSPYYIIGARLSWSLGSLYTHRDSQRLLSTQERSLGLQREAFVTNQQIEATRQRGALDKVQAQLHYDDELIALRRRIYSSSTAKMEHGTLTGVDLMRDLTNVRLAEQEKILHRVQYLQLLYDLRWIAGE
nr:TolC family protein [uncultured Porphyromonas sp.]